MTTPLGQFSKPEADQFVTQRKLFLVPNFAFAPGFPEEGTNLLERYWSEVRDHIENLERSLGGVAHVFHESLYEGGEEGMKMIEIVNSKGYSFIHTMCQSTAKLEATEDKALLEENTDWQRCISLGLVSEKVSNLAYESYQETMQKRYEYIGARIDETLKDTAAGVLFIREDHRVQFPADMQVFYIAPPALDALNRWINDQMRAMSQAEVSQDQ